jgi:LysR family nitrogen assimilation transcriptional regulator
MAHSYLRTRLFVAVYEERSFTGAANREFATQSGVSQHILKLEEQLGVRLFTRDTNRVIATPAGDAYYAACLDVLKSHERALLVARSFAAGLAGDVVIGITPTLARSQLAPALLRFMTDHPNVSVKVSEAYSNVITEKVLAGELSFGVVPALQNVRGLRSRLFARTPEFLVSRGSSRGWSEPVQLSAIGPLKLIVPTPAQTRRTHLENYLNLTGARVERWLELDTMLATLDMVARSDWCAIVPGVMLNESDRDQFSVRRIADPPLTLDLFHIESATKEAEPAALAFNDVLHNVTEEALAGLG